MRKNGGFLWLLGAKLVCCAALLVVFVGVPGGLLAILSGLPVSIIAVATLAPVAGWLIWKAIRRRMIRRRAAGEGRGVGIGRRPIDYA